MTMRKLTWINAAAVVCLLAICAVADAQTRPTTRPAGAGGGAISLDDLFAQLDTNHDGKISRDEATGPYARRFAGWDAAGRGYATREDIHNYRIARGIADDGGRVGPTTGRAPAKVAKLLLEPATWRLEQAPVPPVFAPDVGITGTDETRFAPGMYTTTSDDYFTYAKVMVIDGDVKWTEADVVTFMDRYYRGLSASRARRTGKATGDVGKSTAIALQPGDDGAPARFGARVPFADSFTDGRKVMLNVEVSLLPRPALGKTYMVMLVSPSATDSPTWKHLRAVGVRAVGQMPKPTTRP